VELPNDVPVGGTVSLRLQLMAPAQPGTYPFQWRMVQERVSWFGPFTPLQQVEVAAP
jgi:hypothetical protein